MRATFQRARRLAAWTGLSLCVTTGAQASFGSPADRAPMLVPPLAATPVEQAQPWWTAFREPALTALQRAAQMNLLARDAAPVGPGAALQSDSQTAALYVAMRVFSVRRVLVEDMRANLTQLRAMVAGEPTQRHAQVLAAIDGRLQSTERLAAMFQARRDELVAQLAERCGLSPEVLAQELQPLLAARELPSFDATTPLRLPRAVLASRADVAAARQRLLAERKLERRVHPAWGQELALLSGWIGAPAEPAHPVAAADAEGLPAQDPDADELRQVISQAEREVGTELGELQRLTQQTQRLAQTVQARQLEQLAVTRRLDLGGAAEAEAMAAFEKLLLDGDRLAVSASELALAWIRLHLLTGGQPLGTLARNAEDSSR